MRSIDSGLMRIARELSWCRLLILNRFGLCARYQMAWRLVAILLVSVCASNATATPVKYDYSGSPLLGGSLDGFIEFDDGDMGDGIVTYFELAGATKFSMSLTGHPFFSPRTWTFGDLAPGTFFDFGGPGATPPDPVVFHLVSAGSFGPPPGLLTSFGLTDFAMSGIEGADDVIGSWSFSTSGPGGSPVPEPTSFGLALIGIAVLAGLAHRRRRADRR